MTQTSHENLRSIYILIFLNIAFYFLQVSDPAKYQMLFTFEASRVLAGEVWRLFTYQFIQPSPFWMFFKLLILYIMGSALEETVGTRHFLTFFVLSSVASAVIALLLGFTLLGSLFMFYSLLFAYAYLFPEQTFYLFFVLPVKVKWLAWISLGVALITALLGSGQSIAALGGAAISLGYLWLVFHKPRSMTRPSAASSPPRPSQQPREERSMDENLARFQAMKTAAESESGEEMDKLIAELKPRVVPGVNICPPTDYKPEADDRYCVRCEGFAECSIRWLEASRAEDETEEDARPARSVSGDHS